MSVYLSDTGTRFKGIGCALRVTFAMSVNIDIKEEGISPTLTTSRMSVYLSDAGRTTFVLRQSMCAPLQRPYKHMALLMWAHMLKWQNMFHYCEWCIELVDPSSYMTCSRMIMTWSSLVHGMIWCNIISCVHMDLCVWCTCDIGVSWKLPGRVLPLPAKTCPALFYCCHICFIVCMLYWCLFYSGVAYTFFLLF